MAGEEQFLLKHFREHYSRHPVAGPPEISAREFGVGAFGQKIVRRHLSFASDEKFNFFLREETPFFVSYSSALYKFPERRPMESKELLGADLVYEFDADDLASDCRQKHDRWKCPSCGKEGKGRQLKCDQCGSGTNVDEWFCGNCLNVAKEKVIALLDFLQNDFGFSDGISINFSGRAGYHVHVRSSGIRQLPNSARIELIDYLTANNFSIFSHFKKDGAMLRGPELAGARGWPKRILGEISALLEKEDAERIAVLGSITMAQARKMLSEKGMILNALKRGVLPSVFGRVSSKHESKSDLFWQNFVKSVVEKIAPIDRQTSVDINKIVRVPETLHGETGLVACNVPAGALSSFDPLRDAVVFGSKETVKVLIDKAPSFYLGGGNFGPFNAERAELPVGAAVFLLGRKAAVLEGV